MKLWAIGLWALAALDAGEGSALGTPLRQDGYSVRPPQGFKMARMELFHLTRAGAVGAGEGRWLSAALSDGAEADAASMLISVVEGGFQPNAAARDELSTRVMRHFSEELALKLAIERAELVLGPSPRVEVFGSVKQEDQLRFVLVAAMAGEGRHAVVTFSVPSGRWEALSGTARASLDTFRADPPSSREASRGVAGAAAAVLAGALVLSLALWRRRRRVLGG
ncbi:MAG: hypothetical protein HYZ28_07275 [Myxococcales bacterium]|nr:hypothetical protein [Myxococcales bacterium]